MKKLFLAQVALTTHRYGLDRPSSRSEFRLVWAVDEDHAQRLVKTAVERDDPYGTSVSADVYVTVAIGTPEEDAS